jgi:hypothetical protein
MRRAIDAPPVALFKLIFARITLDAARRYIIDRIEIVGDCWVWLGSGDGRYGHAYFLGKRFKAHVLAYLAFVGPIRRNHVIDHEHCSRPACCHWKHLAAKTQSANIKRAYAIGNAKPNSGCFKKRAVEVSWGESIDEEAIP